MKTTDQDEDRDEHKHEDENKDEDHVKTKIKTKTTNRSTPGASSCSAGHRRKPGVDDKVLSMRSNTTFYGQNVGQDQGQCPRQRELKQN